MRYFRDLLTCLLRVLEKFSIDESKLVGNGLMRDRYIEQQYRKCKEHNRNDT